MDDDELQSSIQPLEVLLYSVQFVQFVSIVFPRKSNENQPTKKEGSSTYNVSHILMKLIILTFQYGRLILQNLLKERGKDQMKNRF